MVVVVPVKEGLIPKHPRAAKLAAVEVGACAGHPDAHEYSKDGIYITVPSDDKAAQELVNG